MADPRPIDPAEPLPQPELTDAARAKLEPVIALLYEHGRFGAFDTTRTAGALVAYAVGLPAFAAVGVLTRAFYALGETRVPVIASFVAVALNLALNLLFVGPLAFLGLGDPSTITWGRLIQNAFLDDAIINDAWWAIIPPGVCVMLVVLACTIIGQALEDALNPRLRTGHLSVKRFRVLPRAARL